MNTRGCEDRQPAAGPFTIQSSLTASRTSHLSISLFCTYTLNDDQYSNKQIRLSKDASRLGYGSFTLYCRAFALGCACFALGCESFVLSRESVSLQP